MKFTCSRESLLTAFQAVSSAVAARTTKPILSCVKLAAADVGEDGLTLTAYDTEVGIRYDLRGVDVREAGAAIVPTTIATILRECHEADVTIEANDNGVKVLVGSSRFEMPGYPVAEFPDLPEFAEKGNYHEVKAGDLRTLINRTKFAADKKDSTRFALSGTLWEVAPKVCRLVTTDSKRLAMAECAATLFGDAETSPKTSHLVPPKALSLLAANLTDDGELVRVCLGNNDAMFQTERAVIYTRLVEGRYPPYRDILAQTRKQTKQKVKIPVGPFLNRLKQAAIMTDDESCRVEFTFADGRVTFQAKGAETGKSDVEMPLPEFVGEAIEVAMDPDFVVEFLRAVEKSGEAVTAEMSDGTKPVLFKAGENTVCLVMPLSG